MASPRPPVPVGKTFGSWTVVAPAGDNSFKQQRYLCRCACGTQRPVNKHTLLSGGSLGCGCEAKKRMSITFRRPVGACSKRQVFLRYKKDAVRRSLEWNIDFACFESLTSSSCFYCGTVPKNRHKSPSGNGDFVYSGIDRMINDIGYTYPNCVPCCWVCNKTKGNMSYDAWMEWLNGLVAFRSRGTP